MIFQCSKLSFHIQNFNEISQRKNLLIKTKLSNSFEILLFRGKEKFVFNLSHSL